MKYPVSVVIVDVGFFTAALRLQVNRSSVYVELVPKSMQKVFICLLVLWGPRVAEFGTSIIMSRRSNLCN